MAPRRRQSVCITARTLVLKVPMMKEHMRGHTLWWKWLRNWTRKMWMAAKGKMFVRKKKGHTWTIAAFNSITFQTPFCLSYHTYWMCARWDLRAILMCKTISTWDALKCHIHDIRGRCDRMEMKRVSASVCGSASFTGAKFLTDISSSFSLALAELFELNAAAARIALHW